MANDPGIAMFRRGLAQKPPPTAAAHITEEHLEVETYCWGPSRAEGFP